MKPAERIFWGENFALNLMENTNDIVVISIQILNWNATVGNPRLPLFCQNVFFSNIFSILKIKKWRHMNAILYNFVVKIKKSQKKLTKNVVYIFFSSLIIDI